jgi:hypothetical protein
MFIGRRKTPTILIPSTHLTVIQPGNYMGLTPQAAVLIISFCKEEVIKSACEHCHMWSVIGCGLPQDLEPLRQKTRTHLPSCRAAGIATTSEAKHNTNTTQITTEPGSVLCCSARIIDMPRKKEVYFPAFKFFGNTVKKTETKCRMLAEERLNEIGATLEHSPRKSLRILAQKTGV